MKRLQKLDGESWREFINAPIAMIVLGKSTCPVCRAWSKELAAFLETDQRWSDVRFGEIFIYEGGAPIEEDDNEEDGTPAAIARALSTHLCTACEPQGSFARENRDWLGEVEDLPHNVLYVNGKRIKSWAGAGIDRLVSRLEKIEPR